VPLTRTELIGIGEVEGRGSAGNPGDPGPVVLLETYPAGWFASERIDTRGYRPLPAEERRRALWERVVTATERMRLPVLSVDPQVTAEAICRRADDLDSVLCLLVGAEALLGRAPGALDLFGDDLLPRMQREGWIWCKSPE
jgi:hypothetical protein